MSQNDELRSIFQEKFGAETQGVPPLVWDGLNGGLAAMQSARRRKRIYIWTSSIVLLLIGTVVLWQGLKGKEVENITNTNVATEETLLAHDITEENELVLGERQDSNLINENVFIGGLIDGGTALTDVDDLETGLLDADEMSHNKDDVQSELKGGNKMTVHTLSTDEDESSLNPTQIKTHVQNDNQIADDRGDSANGDKEKNRATGFESNQSKVEMKDAMSVDDIEISDKSETKRDELDGTEEDLIAQESSRETEQNKDEQTVNTLESEDKKEGNALEKIVSFSERVTETDSYRRTSFIEKMSLPAIVPLAIRLKPLPPLIVIEPIEYPSKWDIGFNYSIGRQIRRTTVDPDNIGDPDFSGDSPTRQLFTAYGVRLNRYFGDHLSVGFGFETSIWRYRTRDYTKKITYATPYEFDSPVGRLDVGENDFQEFYPSGPTTDTISVNLKMFQRLRYVGIPLSIQYDFGKNTLKPYVRFGMIYNFLVRQRTLLIAENAGIEREVNYRDIDGFRRFQLTLQPAVGVNWEVTKKISLFGEGLINLPATKFYTAPNANYQKISSQGRGVNMGIRIKF